MTRFSTVSARRRRASTQTLKMPRVRMRQAGFFDLGISLLILALSGGAVYTIEKNQAETVASAAESVEVSVDRHQAHPADLVASTDAETADLAMR